MDIITHSVKLDKDKCLGCINCIKKCPTGAIRVRNGKASIIKELCIDCGECIRTCPHHAKKAVYDSFESINAYEYKIALVPPSLMSQFGNLDDINLVLTAFKKIGFDDVFEVARAAELVTEAARLSIESGELKTPVISSACPVTERLIKIRFPDLCENVLPLNSPMLIAATIAREEAIKKTNISSDKIGVFFISPCPAKITDIKNMINGEISKIDGALAISDIYPKLVSAMKNISEPEKLSRCGKIGITWARSGGEAAALRSSKFIVADGIENVIKVLEEVENDKLNDMDFIELNACNGGCVGGVLMVTNPYIARTRLHLLRKNIPIKESYFKGADIPDYFYYSEPLKPSSYMRLSESMEESMRMMARIDEITSRLKGIDCGICGAPSCRLLAEDIVKGLAKETDCVFVLREQVKTLAENFSRIDID